MIEPSDNLRCAHNIKAQEALETMQSANSKDWKIISAYYTIYHGLYSLLMKIGVKSEIHSCTIEFVKRLMESHFSEDDFNLVDIAFGARIDSQYYVNRDVPDKKFELIMERTPAFLVKCKNIILDQKEIEEIREKINSIK